jgi:hypothetical protein
MFGKPGNRGYLNNPLVQRPASVLWTPAVLGNDLVAWWDIMDAKSVTRQANGIAKIEDKTTYDNDLSQPIADRQPTWTEHVIADSFEAAYYDGDNDAMVSNFGLSQPFTVVQMIRTGDSLPSNASSFQGAPDDALIYLRNGDIGNEFSLGAGNQIVGTGKVLEYNTNYIVVACFNGANSRANLNGEVFAASGIGPNGITSGPRV